MRPAITVAVCNTIVAMRWGRPGRSSPAVGGRFDDRGDVLDDRRIRGGDIVGVVDHQALGELGEERLLRDPAGRAELVQQQHGFAEAVERVAGRGGLADAIEEWIHLRFEEGEQQLVLAVEVLVEAPQRLLGAVDDLLDGELDRTPSRR